MKLRKNHWCACGKRMSKYSTVCATCHANKMESIHAAVKAVVALGRCPDCGRGLRRNTSMTGWWQCEQNGAEQFRKFPTEPPCSWQGFTQ